MKSLFTSLVTIFLAFSFNALADEKGGHDHDHDHEHEKITGPNGGRLFFSVEPHLEFLVLKDRTVKISAFDHDHKAASIDGFSVKLTGGSRTSPTRLSFEKSGDALVSNNTLPEGTSFPVVVQIKSEGSGKSVLEKFQLNLEDCPTCEYKEYACSCDHDHDHGHDHDHKHDGKS
tara:strand:+ start:10012 stop:10533 length:522 start_codon:yes stop_codon:yes gene_type:complete